MPTFNQLVRKGRQTSVKKSTAPALQKSFNSLQKKTTDMSSPQKRGVCTAVSYTHLDVYKRQHRYLTVPTRMISRILWILQMIM